VPGLPGKFSRKGHAARAHVVPRQCWQHWPWVTPPLSPAQARWPLTGLLPAGLDLVNLLGTRIPTLRRSLVAAYSTCTRALNCLLQAVERNQTWETLKRLLIFPRIALAASGRGGKATRSSSTQHCRINCLAAVMDHLGEFFARIHRQATTDGPRTRAQSGAAASETTAASPQAYDRTEEAVRALLADVAPGQALQLLTSDGVRGAAEPAVLTSLRELHPQAEGTNLEATLPEDRTDVTLSWATDQLLATEAVVRSLPPGSSADPPACGSSTCSTV